MSTRFPKSDHCDGCSFFNPDHAPLPRLRDLLAWRVAHRVRGEPWPRSVAITQRTPLAVVPAARVAVSWINHASFLLQFPQEARAPFRVLIDPIFSRACGVWGQIGAPRVHVPGIAYGKLPAIDAVLISHDHYDHCDLPTLRRLAHDFAPLGIAPLGVGALLRRAGFRRIIELDWWQQLDLAPELSAALTPAQHWSNRLTGRRNGRLWGGFSLKTPARHVYFSGDTAYRAGLFPEIAARLGPPDLALLPIGAYEPRWFMRGQHIDPAEAVQIHRELGARLSIGMHWGTFRLTDEGRMTPPRALLAALEAAQMPVDTFRVMELGESLLV